VGGFDGCALLHALRVPRLLLLLWAQVAVISIVALCISISVWSPHVLAPLDHFVPPLALQIAAGTGALSSLMHFLEVRSCS
jgi:hypothetical protein